MKITEFHIENYRAIRKLSYQFAGNGNVVVLAGLNGSGKSSVLEAILTALGRPSEMREALKGQNYRVQLSLADDTQDARTFNIDSCPGGQRNNNSLPKVNSLYFSSWRAPKRVHGIPLTGKKGRCPDKEERNALWNLKRWLISLPSYANYPSGRERFDKLSIINKEINLMWHDFYPDCNEEFTADIEAGRTAEMLQKGTEAEPRFELYLNRQCGDAERISVDELSSGEIELLALFGTMIADKYLTDKPVDFVFLDEPELHLNPVWHRMLIPMMQKYSPATQFFVATHSPAIWDSVYSTEHIFLEAGAAKEVASW